MTFPEYECHGCIAIYRAGPRYVSWPDVLNLLIVYRYIAISPHALSNKVGGAALAGQLSGYKF